MYNKQEMEEKNKSSYQEQLQENNQIAIVPKGNSMWPTLKNQSQSVIIGAKKERLNEFDVALYVRGQNKFVLHRVLKVLPDGYLTCGDSQFVLEKVDEDQIFGVMLGFYRGKKFVDSKDPKYLKKIKKWYKRKTYRKIRVKLFYLKERVKGKLKGVFRRKKDV